MIVDAIGFTAFALNVVGNILLAYKQRSGWIIRIVSIVCWGAYAWNIVSWPMVANAATFFCINVAGFYKWRAIRVEEQIA